jgi:hypothetical protein
MLEVRVIANFLNRNSNDLLPSPDFCNRLAPPLIAHSRLCKPLHTDVTGQKELRRDLSLRQIPAATSPAGFRKSALLSFFLY